jgi:hypothetical protein
MVSFSTNLRRVPFSTHLRPVCFCCCFGAIRFNQRVVFITRVKSGVRIYGSGMDVDFKIDNTLTVRQAWTGANFKKRCMALVDELFCCKTKIREEKRRAEKRRAENRRAEKRRAEKKKSREKKSREEQLQVKSNVGFQISAGEKKSKTITL